MSGHVETPLGKGCSGTGSKAVGDHVLKVVGYGQTGGRLGPWSVVRAQDSGQCLTASSGGTGFSEVSEPVTSAR